MKYESDFRENSLAHFRSHEHGKAKKAKTLRRSNGLATHADHENQRIQNPEVLLFDTTIADVIDTSEIERATSNQTFARKTIIPITHSENYTFEFGAIKLAEIRKT